MIEEKYIGKIIYNDIKYKLYNTNHLYHSRENQNKHRDSIPYNTKIDIINKSLEFIEDDVVYSIVSKYKDYYIGIALAKDKNDLVIITIINSKSNTKETDIWKNKPNRIVLK